MKIYRTKHGTIRLNGQTRKENLKQMLGLRDELDKLIRKETNENDINQRLARSDNMIRFLKNLDYGKESD